MSNHTIVVIWIIVIFFYCSLHQLHFNKFEGERVHYLGVGVTIQEMFIEMQMFILNSNKYYYLYTLGTKSEDMG